MQFEIIVFHLLFFVIDDDWDESSDASGSKNYPSAKRGGKRGRLSKMSKLLSRTPVKPIDVDDDGQEDGQKNFTRTLYGPMEKCFVIDARNIGNIGRYFNVRSKKLPF